MLFSLGDTTTDAISALLEHVGLDESPTKITVKVQRCLQSCEKVLPVGAPRKIYRSEPPLAVLMFDAKTTLLEVNVAINGRSCRASLCNMVPSKQQQNNKNNFVFECSDLEFVVQLLGISCALLPACDHRRQKVAVQLLASGENSSPASSCCCFFVQSATKNLTATDGNSFTNLPHNLEVLMRGHVPGLLDDDDDERQQNVSILHFKLYGETGVAGSKRLEFCVVPISLFPRPCIWYDELRCYFPAPYNKDCLLNAFADPRGYVHRLPSLGNCALLAYMNTKFCLNDIVAPSKPTTLENVVVSVVSFMGGSTDCDILHETVVSVALSCAAELEIAKSWNENVWFVIFCKNIASALGMTDLGQLDNISIEVFESLLLRRHLQQQQPHNISAGESMNPSADVDHRTDRPVSLLISFLAADSRSVSMREKMRQLGASFFAILSPLYQHVYPVMDVNRESITSKFNDKCFEDRSLYNNWVIVNTGGKGLLPSVPRVHAEHIMSLCIPNEPVIRSIRGDTGCRLFFRVGAVPNNSVVEINILKVVKTSVAQFLLKLDAVAILKAIENSNQQSSVSGFFLVVQSRDFLKCVVEKVACCTKSGMASYAHDECSMFVDKGALLASARSGSLNAWVTALFDTPGGGHFRKKNFSAWAVLV